MSTSPLVSVILPVYNTELYLKESVESILNQSYTNFELLILNDGSSDNSEKICLSYKDKRIKYYYHANIGLAATLNKGIELSVGKYIARQDGDDISHINRFKEQVEFLENNPDIVLLGTRARIFSDNKLLGFHNHAVNSAVLKFDLMFNNPFVHSSVMFKKENLLKTGGYSIDRNFFEDYDLWSKFSQIGNVANLKNVLVEYRHHDKGLSKGTLYYKEDAVYNQSLKNIELLMGYKNDVFNSLAALFHKKDNPYRKNSKQELHFAIKQISHKIIDLYPNDKSLIEQRLTQYIRIINYRLNMIKRTKYNNDPFKIILLRIENKICRLHPNLINE